jgi:hypothetical protein
LKTAIGAILSVSVTVLRHGAMDGVSLPVIYSGFYEMSNLPPMKKLAFSLVGAIKNRFLLKRISQAKQNALAAPSFRAVSICDAAIHKI